MGHVREERAKKILEDALISYLDDGTIPTTGELKDSYDDEVELQGDFSLPAIKRLSGPERFSESSASAMMDIKDLFGEDLIVLLRSLLAVTEVNQSYLTEWSARASTLDSRLARLKSRLDSLVLLQGDVAGYVSFVEDPISTLEFIDTDNTTAEIDVDTGEASLAVDRAKIETVEQGSVVDLTSATINWDLITRDRTQMTVRPTGSDLRNLLNKDPTNWTIEIQVLPTWKPPLVGELRLTLPSAQDISKVTILTANSSTSSPLTVVLQYSVNGYTWENVPCDTYIQSGRGNFVFRFPKISFRYLKFILSKSSYDATNNDGRSIYFSIQQIKLFTQEFRIEETGTEFRSTFRTPTLGGEDVTFGKVALEVCEEVPDKTSIDYYIRAKPNTGSDTDWVKVVPLNRKVISNGLTINESSDLAVIDFSAQEDLSSEDLSDVFDSTKDVEALNILRKYNGGDLPYRFLSPNDTTSNFFIDESDNDLTDLTLLRNVGYSDSKFPNVTTDLKVGDIECGWGIRDESVYFCAFQIKNPAGQRFSLGQGRYATIDGITHEGTTPLISQGWHTFETNKSNWISLTGSTPGTLAALKALDPLYPYNHKYIIEGFSYPSYFTDQKDYIGVDAYCRYCSEVSPSTHSVAAGKRVGLFDFQNETSVDMSIFAIDTFTDSVTPTITPVFVLLKYDPNKTNNENERVRLFYSKKNSDFKSVQLKAIFKTEDSLKTPTLSHYRILVK